MIPGVPSDSLEILFTICGEAIVVVNPEAVIEAWNPAAARMFGWSAAEAVGSPWELRQLRPNGERLDLEIHSTRRPSGGFLIVAADRKMARDASRFQELLEAAPDAIIEVDRSGRVVLVNRVAETLFGYSRAELLSMNVDELIPEASRSSHAANRAHYWKSPATRPMGRDMVLSARRRGGTEIPVEISLSPVKSDDGFRVTAIIRDVTERRVAEEKIRAANLELAERNREIQKADRLKSEFLASMSHELRTPLHTIIGFTELLAEQLEGPLNDKQKRFIEHVHKDSVHLLELINDILDLSKIESGRMDLDLSAVNATDVLDDVLSGIIRAANNRDITIENRLQKSVNVRADRVRLREIFSNLLSNAIKFTPAGGTVTIDVERDSPDLIRFLVRDTGIGIAPDDQEIIFDKFRQVGSTTRGVREGTGLGLAIVKHLVEMHGGRVHLESTPGEGSCFSFTIPAVRTARDGGSPVVLIIEDEPAARDLIASYLNPLGINTQIALSPTGAAAMAKALRPDAITLDLLMPGRSGWRILSELRSAPETSATPVLVMSVLDRDSEAMSLGATDYLQKPVKKDTLVKALSNHVPAVRAVLNK